MRPSSSPWMRIVEVIAEAREKGAGLLVCHHPPIFRPLSRLDTDQPTGALLRDALVADVAIFAAHTNLDASPHGVNVVLADLFELEGHRPLLGAPAGESCKLVTFVPAEHVPAVSAALFEAGAGVIGDYTGCSFRTGGTGTFTPGPGAHPAYGDASGPNEVSEVRLELVVAGERVEEAVRALLASHPYEEPAFDVYLLHNPSGAGMGRVGDLPAPISLGELARRCRTLLSVPAVRLAGDPAIAVRRVAVCGGSGGDMARAALAAGAQVLITEMSDTTRRGTRQRRGWPSSTRATTTPRGRWCPTWLRCWRRRRGSGPGGGNNRIGKAYLSLERWRWRLNELEALYGIQELDIHICELREREENHAAKMELQELVEKEEALDAEMKVTAAALEETSKKQHRMEEDVQGVDEKLGREERSSTAARWAIRRSCAACRPRCARSNGRRTSWRRSFSRRWRVRTRRRWKSRHCRPSATGCRRRWTAKREVLEGELAEIKAEIADLEAKRAELRSGVDEEILELYDELLKSKHNVAVVKVIDGVCQGCRVELPGIEFDRYLKSEGVFKCTNCGRILVK